MKLFSTAKRILFVGFFYRQHNFPESLQIYFDESVEKYIPLDRPVYVISDFNMTCLSPSHFLLAKDS